MTDLVGHEEYRESRARLFDTGWPIATDYRVEESLVVPVDATGRRISCEVGRFYMPLARPELPPAFAQVSSGDAAAALAFVRRYGLPGYAFALTPVEEHARRLARTAPGVDPLLDTRYDSLLPGDPLAWIQAHAETVDFVGRLGAALEHPTALRDLFEPRIRRREDGREELRFTRAVRGQTRPKDGRLPVPDDAASRRRTATQIIALCLTENLGGVARTVAVDAGRLTTIFRRNNLLDAIYWLLADAVTHERLRVCAECGHFFALTDPRMKHCPPLMGLSGPSRCMHRAKMRRWRAGHTQPRPQRRRRRRPPQRSAR